WLSLKPGLFYALMTLHGAGMITAVVLCGMGGLWYLIRREAELDARIAVWAWALIAAGVVAVLLSVFPGQFAAGWTFLYPLPFVGAYWPNWATGAFLIGVALITAGWSLWCLQLLAGLLVRYGGWRGALAWDYVLHPMRFAASGREAPPPQAFAALVAAVDGLLAGVAGMVVGVALLAHWVTPSLPIDPLWAKNLTYFFGHTFANLAIYMTVAFVYVGLPRYTPGREWHTSRVLAAAWWGTLLFVGTAFFHHLYMDFVQPESFQVAGEIASYLSAVPTAVVTIYGGALLIYRSGMRWTLAPIFMYAGLVGWLIGGVGALLDATVPINSQLHNTLWVPAHFHTYLLDGVVSFILGWVFLLLEERSGKATPLGSRWAVSLTIFAGSALLLGSWFVSGADSLPRRYATLPPPGPELSQWASIGLIILIAGYLFCGLEAARLAMAARRTPQRNIGIQSVEVPS
ncbi:MAG TPA: cbb3-type cytochrome c oxidase subunit I, partial [Limnochordia bacterium]|nr:cbb3-type cytochrome c oxidase subunit I [Limnochordia bacterium]